MSGTALVWFRRDLRLADNPALAHALKTHAAVIPVFIWAAEEEAPWPPGAASRWWLHQSLESLAAGLEKVGSRLILRKGPSTETLLTVARETGADAVYWNRRYEPAVVARDTAAKQELKAAGLTAESFPGNLLWEPWIIANTSGKPFQVFTPFWNTCRKHPPAAPLAAPSKITAPAVWPASLPLADLHLEPAPNWASGFRDSWSPGEPGATRMAKAFAADNYTTQRDLPAQRGTSRLSPHLHFGEITPRRLWHALPQAEPYLRQLAWREFAHHLLFHFPHTPSEPLRPEFARFPWKFDAAHFAAWTKGLTGYPLVDAGMRELWHTGWMHNRVRMVAASFLVKHLLISWHEGAAWFWDTLVDADLANNTLGWQWTAGCGADAAPYFRIFNPILQGEKFDPEGAYVRRWVPELAGLPTEYIYKPWQAPAAIRPSDYPAPIVDHDQARKRALEALATLKAR